ncbi:MAG: inositol monophosphatase family protein [Fervidicoccaceae archaeon]
MVNSKLDDEHLRKVSLSISREAAELLRELSEKGRAKERVEGRGEAIAADIISEEHILSRLREEGFSGRVIAEESGITDMGEDDLVVIIDPLDGSKNYARSIRWCSVSIAFADRSKNDMSSFIAGSVYPVFWDEPISFSISKGVFIGDKRVTKEDVLSSLEKRENERYFAIYMDEEGAIEEVSKVYRIFSSIGNKLSLRSLGSAALELAYVSIGRIDAFVDARSRLRIVDAAAGAGMVIAQGGSVLDLNGNSPRINFDGMYKFRNLVSFLDERFKKLFFGRGAS